MLQNYLNKIATYRISGWSKLWLVPLWVIIGFYLSAQITEFIVYVCEYAGVPVQLLNPAVYGLVVSVVIYALTLGFVMGAPLLAKRPLVTLEAIGLTRLPSWKDIGLAPAGFIIYFIASAVAMIAIKQIFPGINLDQAQDIGFKALSVRYEYILAFLALVVIAPIAEEVLFRGYLYGKLRGAVPTWAAILVTSVVFGAIHGQWNVGIDVFILSIVLCSLREVTGSISAGILLHMLKNGVAFYFLFINPSLLHTLGG